MYLFYATLEQGQLFKANQAYYNQAARQRQLAEKELAYWKNLAEKYKNYPDAYLKVASLEYSLGNTQASRAYTKKALSINPDRETGKVLGEQINRQ